MNIYYVFDGQNYKHGFAIKTKKSVHWFYWFYILSGSLRDFETDFKYQKENDSVIKRII